MHIFPLSSPVFSLYSFSWNTWFVFSYPCFLYLCVFGTQVFSSSPWHCVQMQPLETCRRKPWSSIMAPTLKWYFVDRFKKKRVCMCIGNWICLQNSEGKCRKKPCFCSENCVGFFFCVCDVTDWVVLTGVVLVLHRFCLHTDRPALCGRAGASSGILLRGEFTWRQ